MDKKSEESVEDGSREQRNKNFENTARLLGPLHSISSHYYFLQKNCRGELDRLFDYATSSNQAEGKSNVMLKSLALALEICAVGRSGVCLPEQEKARNCLREQKEVLACESLVDDSYKCYRSALSTALNYDRVFMSRVKEARKRCAEPFAKLNLAQRYVKVRSLQGGSVDAEEVKKATSDLKKDYDDCILDVFCSSLLAKRDKACSESSVSKECVNLSSQLEHCKVASKHAISSVAWVNSKTKEPFK
ncbi:hypothetical protein AKO1_002338 [Acrasis kona]|uniref:Uncharacterized protein n=1 Tax=Acrasis kona TaxID=1008807 RepID=A0AAW2ZR41_9EUKA